MNERTPRGRAKSGNRPGRPSFLLSKVIGPNGDLIPIADAMCDRIRIGVSLNGACDAYVDRTSFFRTLTLGAEDLAAGKKTIYADFATQIARARAECRTFYANHIAVASPTDWRAAAWMLERQFHEEYAERRHVDVQGMEAPRIMIQLPSWARAPEPKDVEVDAVPVTETKSLGGVLANAGITVRNDLREPVK